MTWRPAVEGEGYRCLTPRYLRDKGYDVPCGVCGHCRALRGRDWAGRAIAESKMADRTLFCTLTVGGDHMYEGGVKDNIRAQEFHRDDVRLYIARMRKYMRPGRARVMWVGENGDAKGRVHYHCLLYLRGTNGPEDLVLDRMYFHGRMEPGVVTPGSKILHMDGKYTFWPYGVSHYREFKPANAFYLSSYVTKTFRKEDGLDGCEYTRPGVSTKPLLGAEWFMHYARLHVQQGLVPQGRTYDFGREDGWHGPISEFWMGDATWRLFLRAYVEEWHRVYGDRPFPRSDALQEHLEMLDDERAARRPYDEEWFAATMKAELRLKADLLDTAKAARRVKQVVRDAMALSEAGIVPVVKRDGVDDALNAALAIADDEEKRSLIGNLRVDLRAGPSIAEQEAEWVQRFGSFEDHEKRWQAEVLRRR